jgi:predicted dehydrogenase
MASQTPIKFAAVGLNHGHIYAMVDMLQNAGAQLAAFYSREPELAKPFAEKYSDAKQAADVAAILEDPSIQLIVSAAIPFERAALACDAMRHGKDVLMDKPGATTLDQLAELRRVQSDTGRIYSICYAERLDQRATVAGEKMVHAGAIGKVVQTLGLGPHRPVLHTRPPWFFEREKYGGILTDIGSHQCDQFLAFTQSDSARIVASQVGNMQHPQHPELEDFGDATFVGSSGAAGYIRVDWFTPDGLPTWGDARLIVIGTEGTMEIRKYVDLAGRHGGDHLFLVDKKGMQYIDCSNEPLPYAGNLLADIRNRTETAMTQRHCFAAMELALQAEAQAQRIGSVNHR